MDMILKEYRESSETLASLCAGNLARLGRLYVREGRFNEAREVLALAARLGSMEAQVEMNNYSSREVFRSRYRFAG